MSEEPLWPIVDPSLLRGAMQYRLSRRGFLRLAGASAGAAGLSAVLSACGVSGSSGTTTGTAEGTAAWWAKQKQAGVLNFANWPYYIDPPWKPHPTLETFTQQTGIKVNYRPVINENSTFLATIRPQLQAGQDTGWDLMVITNGIFFDQLKRNGWIIPLDQSRLTNFNKYASPIVKNPTYDPGNKYSVAWQSGYTGIGYDPDKTGKDITSFMDMFDPAFSGKVGYFGDTLDMPNFTMVGLGIDPETSGESDWKKAADFLTKQKDDGLIRKFYTQDYIDALGNGDIWITTAWNGDIVQKNAEEGTNLNFVIPEQGGVVWTDNQMIPARAQHPVDAMVYMDSVYDPEVQARITDWNQYLSPVPACKDIIASELGDPAAAHDILIFPTSVFLSELTRYRELTPTELTTWDQIFQPVYQG
jgi:spermidine/putrescine transport system substrate-binding protein